MGGVKPREFSTTAVGKASTWNTLTLLAALCVIDVSKSISTRHTPTTHAQQLHGWGLLQEEWTVLHLIARVARASCRYELWPTLTKWFQIAGSDSFLASFLNFCCCGWTFYDHHIVSCYLWDYHIEFCWQLNQNCLTTTAVSFLPRPAFKLLTSSF